MSEGQSKKRWATWTVIVAGVLSVVWPLVPEGLRGVGIPSLGDIARNYSYGGMFMHVILAVSIGQAVLAIIWGKKHVTQPRALWPLFVLPTLAAFVGVIAAHIGVAQAAAAVGTAPDDMRVQMWTASLSIADLPRYYGLMVAASGSLCAAVVVVVGHIVHAGGNRPTTGRRLFMTGIVLFGAAWALWSAKPFVTDGIWTLGWAIFVISVTGMFGVLLLPRHAKPEQGQTSDTLGLRSVLTCGFASAVGVAAPLAAVAFISQANGLEAIATAPPDMKTQMLTVSISIWGFSEAMHILVPAVIATTGIWAVGAIQHAPAVRNLTPKMVVVGAAFLVLGGVFVVGNNLYEQNILTENQRLAKTFELGLPSELSLPTSSSEIEYYGDHGPLVLTSDGASMGGRDLGKPGSEESSNALASALDELIPTAEHEERVAKFNPMARRSPTQELLCEHEKWGVVAVAAHKNLAAIDVLTTLQRLENAGVCRVKLMVSPEQTRDPDHVDAKRAAIDKRRIVPKVMKELMPLFDIHERVINTYLVQSLDAAGVDVSVRVGEKSVEIGLTGDDKAPKSVVERSSNLAETIRDVMGDPGGDDKRVIALQFSGPGTHQDLISLLDALQGNDRQTGLFDRPGHVALVVGDP